MAGTRQRVVGMQRDTRLRFLQIFADDAAFEQHRLAAVLLLDPQQWHFAQRRDLQEPVGLVGKIDVDALEGHALFEQSDRGALHIGAEMMADEGKLAHGGLLGNDRCKCI